MTRAVYRLGAGKRLVQIGIETFFGIRWAWEIQGMLLILSHIIQLLNNFEFISDNKYNMYRGDAVQIVADMWKMLHFRYDPRLSFLTMIRVSSLVYCLHMQSSGQNGYSW